jgi:hypothetical protein
MISTMRSRGPIATLATALLAAAQEQTIADLESKVSRSRANKEQSR